MEVTPQHPPASAQARPQYSGGRLPAWPPQVQTGNHQHHAPASSQFHQPVAEGADHQLAMQCPSHGLQIELGILLAQHFTAVGVDKHVKLAPAVVDHKLSAALRVDWRQVLADMALWISGLHAQ